METLVIKDFLNTESAINHEEGLSVFKALYEKISHHRSVVLSFEGIEDWATAFLNASIGNLYVHLDKTLVESHLKITGVEATSLLEVKIKKVIDNASDPKKRELHNQIVHEASSL